MTFIPSLCSLHTLVYAPPHSKFMTFLNCHYMYIFILIYLYIPKYNWLICIALFVCMF